MPLWQRLGVLVFALAMLLVVVSVGEGLAPRLLGIDAAGPELLRDPDALAEFVGRQPLALYVGIALAHGFGALSGGMALGFARLTRPWLIAYAVLAVGLGYVYARALPLQPDWAVLLNAVATVAGGYLGWRWVDRAREVAARQVG